MGRVMKYYGIVYCRKKGKRKNKASVGNAAGTTGKQQGQHYLS
jgi:hypothetical protein